VPASEVLSFLKENHPDRQKSRPGQQSRPG